MASTPAVRMLVVHAHAVSKALQPSSCSRDARALRCSSVWRSLSRSARARCDLALSSRSRCTRRSSRALHGVHSRNVRCACPRGVLCLTALVVLSPARALQRRISARRNVLEERKKKGGKRKRFVSKSWRSFLRVSLSHTGDLPCAEGPPCAVDWKPYVTVREHCLPVRKDDLVLWS